VHLRGNLAQYLRLQLRESTFGREKLWRSASGDGENEKKQEVHRS